jgi:hypothetical protein
MIDDEMQFLLKFFTERIQYLVRIITRCQQEGITDLETLLNTILISFSQVNLIESPDIVNYMIKCPFLFQIHPLNIL